MDRTLVPYVLWFLLAPLGVLVAGTVYAETVMSMTECPSVATVIAAGLKQTPEHCDLFFTDFKSTNFKDADGVQWNSLLTVNQDSRECMSYEAAMQILQRTSGLDIIRFVEYDSGKAYYDCYYTVNKYTTLRVSSLPATDVW